MSIILGIVALLASVVGLLNLTQATTGVGFICGACLLAIFARMAQASDHHLEICRRLKTLAETSPSSAPEGSEKKSLIQKLKEEF